MLGVIAGFALMMALDMALGPPDESNRRRPRRVLHLEAAKRAPGADDPKPCSLSFVSLSDCEQYGTSPRLRKGARTESRPLMRSCRVARIGEAW